MNDQVIIAQMYPIKTWSLAFQVRQRLKTDLRQEICLEREKQEEECLIVRRERWTEQIRMLKKERRERGATLEKKNVKEKSRRNLNM